MKDEVEVNNVKVNTKTTLVLNSMYLPMYDTTARNAVHMLIRGRITGFDRNFVPHTWQEWLELAPKAWTGDELNTHYFYEDQPCLPTSGKPIPIPTIVVVTTKYLFKTRSKAGKRPSRRFLIEFYNHRCQCCHERFSSKDLTIDHVYPKSKGGDDHEMNYLLLCKTCNNKKGSMTPFFDIEGRELKAKPLPEHYCRVGEHHRPEWSQFLVFNK